MLRAGLKIRVAEAENGRTRSRRRRRRYRRRPPYRRRFNIVVAVADHTV